MKQPQFNYKDINGGGVKNGSDMKISSILDMPMLKSKLRYIQFYNSGKKESIEEKHFNKWNGTCFVDIDYKNYYDNKDNHKEPIYLMNEIYTWLQQNCKNFYYGELSRSGKGFHFLFYLDTEYPTQERADYLNLLARAAVKKSFIETGNEDIYDYPGVSDDCSNSYGQGCYLTGNGKINELCSPEKLDISNIQDIFEELKNVKSSKNSSEKLVKNGVKCLCLNIRDVEKDEIEYISHTTRWRLFTSLSRVFSGKELKKEWEKCAELIPEENGHTTEYYKQIPYKGDWNKNLTGDEYCDRELLYTFGYDVDIDVNKKNLANIELINKIYNMINYEETDENTN